MRLLGLLCIGLLPVLSWAQDARSTAIAQFHARQYAAAEQSFEILRTQSPQDPEILYYLGYTHLHRKRAAAAVEALRRAVERAPANAEYRLRLGEALAVHINEVGFLSKAGIAGEIRESFSQAVALAPEWVEAREDLMQFLLQAPAIAGGSRALAAQQAAEIMKRNAAHGHLAYGELARYDGHYEDAIRELRTAVAGAPQDADLQYQLGMLYASGQRYAEAAELFAAMAHADPASARAQYQLGKMAALSGERLQEGERALRAYLTLGPQDADDPPLAAAEWQLGMIYAQQQRKEDARREYRIALQLDPENEDVIQALKKLD